MLSETEKKVRQYLREKVRVHLDRNNELGYWVWAICVDEDPEFWIGSFKTRGVATAYCKRHGLKITGTNNGKIRRTAQR